MCTYVYRHQRLGIFKMLAAYYSTLNVMHGSCANTNVIPIQSVENCSFRSVSYFMYNTEDRHSDLRFNTLNKIFNERKYYKDFMMDLRNVNSAEDYKSLFFRDRKCCGILKMDDEAYLQSHSTYTTTTHTLECKIRNLAL